MIILLLHSKDDIRYSFYSQLYHENNKNKNKKLLTSFLAYKNICMHRHLVYSIRGPIFYLKNDTWTKSKTKRDCWKTLTHLFFVFSIKKHFFVLLDPTKLFLPKFCPFPPFLGPKIFFQILQHFFREKLFWTTPKMGPFCCPFLAQFFVKQSQFFFRFPDIF